MISFVKKHERRKDWFKEIAPKLEKMAYYLAMAIAIAVIIIGTTS